MRFKDKVVIITGGYSGIGKATAILFAKEEAKVMVADLAEKMSDDLVEEIEATGSEASYVRVNVTDLADVKRMIEQTVAHLGRFDILVNSAGILGPRIRTDKYPEEDFDKVINVNVKGLWNCMKVALPHFITQRS